jgi:hypothetical protein
LNKARYFEPEEIEAYERWIETNPSGYVFTVKGADSKLHRSGCFHIEVYPGDKGRGCPKVAGTQSAVRQWIKANGYTISRCQSCYRHQTREG